MIRLQIVAELRLVSESIGQAIELIETRVHEWKSDLSIRRLATDPVVDRVKLLGTLAVEPGGPAIMRRVAVTVRCYAGTIGRATAAFELAVSRDDDPHELTIEKLDCAEPKRRGRR